MDHPSVMVTEGDKKEQRQKENFKGCSKKNFRISLGKWLEKV
jgi:hypothetical protein